jgi:DNA-binding CsgD family transcriptional regulator
VPQVAAHLTPRERQIANLIGLGYTNREIGVELWITERTAGTHVQNILNKLGASNRAQIAAWAAQESLKSQGRSHGYAHTIALATAAPVVVPKGSVKFEGRLGWAPAILVVLAIVVAATQDGSPALMAPGTQPPAVGDLAYQAPFRPDGEGFGSRYVLGDPTASDIKFTNEGVEFVVLKAGGNTGNNLAMESMSRYYTEATLSVQPGSNVEFWINLGSNGYATHIGDHLIDFETASELMQLQYLNFVDNKGGVALGPQVHVRDLLSGRAFVVGAVVDPPLYEVFLDGRMVVKLEHAPSAEFQQISFAIFGEGGMVRLTSMRVYRLSGTANRSTTPASM